MRSHSIPFLRDRHTAQTRRSVPKSLVSRTRRARDTKDFSLSGIHVTLGKELGVEAVGMADRDFSPFLEWSPEAEAKLKSIPFFVRPQARQRIEQLARLEDLEVVTVELVERARHEFGQ